MLTSQMVGTWLRLSSGWEVGACQLCPGGLLDGRSGQWRSMESPMRSLEGELQCWRLEHRPEPQDSVMPWLMLGPERDKALTLTTMWMGPEEHDAQRSRQRRTRSM